MTFDRDAHKREWNRQRAQKNTSLVNRWKMTKGCKQCGYKKHSSALVLDHLDQTTKDRNKRSKSYNPLWSKDRLKEDLSKIQVLCANCHNIRTYEEEHYKFRGSGQ